MTRVRFATGVHLWLHNCEYVIKQKAENKFQLLNESTLQTTWLTEKQLVQSFFAHELTFKNPVEDKTLQSYQEADYVQIPDSLKAKAERKEKYIRAVLDQNLETYTPASLTPIIRAVALMVEDSHPPSFITLYRWLKDYHHSGGDIRSLIPRHRAKGNYNPKIAPSVMQCLLHTIRPKDYVKEKFPSVKKEWNVYGLMEVLVVDNGKEFYSKHFQDACQQLGITIQYTPPYMPWYKSSVERTFGSYNTQLLKGQPGTLLQEFTSQYDYNPRKNAVVSLEALQEMLHIFIVDLHNQSSHPQLLAPRAEVWSKGIAKCPLTLPTTLQDLRVLVGAMEKRVISRRGVELYGLYYNSPELARLRSNYEPEDNRRKDGKRSREKATIKYDPTDLSTIYVLDPTTHQFLVVPAVNQEYTQGLTLWQHRVIKNLAAMSAKRVDLVALALAKQQIQEIVEREWKQSHRGKTRKSMARWLGIGRDDNKVAEFSASTEQLREQPQIASPETDRELTNFFQPSPSIIGISDLGNAYNRSPNLSDTHNLSIEVSKQEEIPEIIETNKSSLKKSQPQSRVKPPQKSVNSEQLAPLSPESESVSRTDEWKPDLTGWEVSIGLPT